MNKENIKEQFKKAMDTVKDTVNNVPKKVATYVNSSIDPYYEIKKMILDKIKEYNTIIINRHIRPDGDCMGASFGLRNILRLSFPEKKIYSVGKDKAKYLEFMGEEDEITPDDYTDALVIVVDTADRKRISSDNYDKAKEIIKIDHHVQVDAFGAINYVRDTVAAACLLITDFFETFKKELKMDEEGATALYTGIITDTGRFKYSDVDATALKLSSKLLEYQINTQNIFANLYLDSRESLKLKGYIMRKFLATPNGVNYMYLSKRIQKKFSVSTEEASAQVNIMEGIKNNLIWILFIETDTGIRVRLRSRYISIIEIANQFNGGGHLYASGATVHNKKEMKQLLAVADEKLQEFKKNNKDVF